MRLRQWLERQPAPDLYCYWLAVAAIFASIYLLAHFSTASMAVWAGLSAAFVTAFGYSSHFK